MDSTILLISALALYIIIIYYRGYELHRHLEDHGGLFTIFVAPALLYIALAGLFFLIPYIAGATIEVEQDVFTALVAVSVVIAYIAYFLRVKKGPYSP